MYDKKLYRREILDHYHHPRNFGRIKNPDLACSKENSFCGDKIKIAIKLNARKRAVKEIKFSGKGCVISQAAASLLTEFVKGKSLTEVKKLSFPEFLSEVLKIELTPLRMKCAELPFSALKEALEQKG
jgi:nitrogen fixation NifU-like protein